MAAQIKSGFSPPAATEQTSSTAPPYIRNALSKYPQGGDLRFLLPSDPALAFQRGRAAVFKFANGAWAAADGGVSTLWLLQNPTTTIYRLVGRDDTSQQYNVNFGFVADIVHHKATETFLQFKVTDDNYGLNFGTADECNALAGLVGQIMAHFAPALPSPILASFADDDDTGVAGGAKKKRTSQRPLARHNSSKGGTLTKRSAKASAEELSALYEEPPAQPEKPESVRDKAAKEIYTSEVSYVKSLTSLSEAWMTPMKKLLSPEDFTVLFSNIETIRQFNQSLCAELEKRMANWSDTQKIGNVFVSMSNSLKIYKPYCENYDVALNKYQEVVKKAKVKEFVRAAEQQSGGFSLTFYLIMPVQRIPRYMLLLKELISKTAETHPDYEDLKKAHGVIAQIAEEVNRGVGDAEKEKKKQEIMKRNYLGLDALLLPHRVVLFDGEVDVSAGAYKSNWIILFNDIIVFATEGKNRVVNNHFVLDYSWLIDLSDVGPNCFEIQTPEASAFITCKDKVTKDRWVDTVDTTIKNWLNKKNLVKAEDPKVRVMMYEYQDKSIYWGEWLASKPMGTGRATSPNGSVFTGTFVKGVLHGTGSATYKTGETYEGDWARDLPHGKGKLVVPGKTGRTYEGDWESGKKKGKGVLRWDNGDVYDGDWDQDRFSGKGSLTKADGTKYIGDWKEGKRHGKGSFTGPTGDTYEGDWVHDARTGKGKQMENGTTFEGQFLDNRRHGSGVFETALYKYEGSWVQDKKHGKGTLTAKSGEVYVGEWEQDKRSGPGKQSYLDGSSYEGQWAENRRNGKGTWVHPTAGHKYDGQWKDDYRHGQGVSTEGTTVYDGEWIADRRDGKGKMIWPNGTSYDGSWKNNQRHGDGVFVWADGAKYNGQWAGDKRNGTGTLDTAAGLWGGEWKDDKREGNGSWRGKDGTLYKGEWKDDKKQGKGILTHSGGIETEQGWREGFLIKPGIKHFAPDLPDMVYF